jgi:hypothetical protein
MQYQQICGRFTTCSTKGVWTFPIDSIVIKDVQVQKFGGIVGLAQKWNKFRQPNLGHAKFHELETLNKKVVVICC